MPEMLLSSIQETLAETLGVDLANPAANDKDLVSALNSTMDGIKRRMAEKGLSTDTPLPNADQGLGFLQDAIRESAAELRAARAPKPGGEGYAPVDPNSLGRKTEPDMADDLKAGLAFWEEFQRRGVRSFSSFDIPTSDFHDVVTRPTTNADVQRFQRTNDELMVAAAMMGHRRGGPDGRIIANVLPMKTWERLSGRLQGYMARALDTTEHSDWVPTEMSADMVERIYEATNIMSLIPRIDFPSGIGSLDIPTEGADVNIYITGEATADDGDPKYQAGTPGVGKVSLTPKTFASRIVTSVEMVEDSAIAIAPYMALKLQRAFARDLDDAIINGDTTATHHDTGRTMASNDRRRAFTGLIEKALTDTGANSDCATFIFENFIKPTILMQEYADDPTRVVCIMNRSTAMQLGYLRDTNNNNVFLTAQDWGAGTTPAQGGPGLIGQVYGYRVVTSAKVNRDLNTSGIYDGSTTTKSLAIWAHLDALLMAVKRDMQLVGVDRPEQGQRVMVGTYRAAFAHVPATSTDLSVALSYGIPNGA